MIQARREMGVECPNKDQRSETLEGRSARIEGSGLFFHIMDTPLRALGHGGGFRGDLIPIRPPWTSPQPLVQSVIMEALQRRLICLWRAPRAPWSPIEIF